MKTALRRIGLIGFLFFFVKGMLWLTIPAAIVAFRGCDKAPSSAGSELPMMHDKAMTEVGQ